MNKEIYQIEQVIDKEIEVFLKIEQCLIDKKNIIIKGDIEALTKIDENFANYDSNIKDIYAKRKELQIKLGGENLTFAEIIKKTASIDKDLAERIAEKKLKMDKTIKNIKNQNMTITELLKHSLNLVEASIRLISNTLNPEMSAYNKTGRAQKNQISERMCSIIMEA